MVLLRYIALLAAPVWCQVLPRQTTFSNSSSTSPTTTSTSTGAAVTEPPPCCFIVGGTFAVGVNRWWSTSIEEVVATVITNIGRYNDNSTKVLNSTTIYKGANQTFAASSFSEYAASQLAVSPITSPIVVPTNLLTGDGAQLTGAGDYAATAVDNKTYAAWDFTTLTVASPTPYDEWMAFGIFTYRPPVPSNVTTPLSTYESSMCGYWSTYITESYSTGKLTSTTETLTWTSLESGTITTTSTETTVYSFTDGTEVPVGTAAPTFVPNDDLQASYLFAGPPFPGLWNTDKVTGSGYSDLGATNLGMTYIQPVATQVPDGQAAIDIPTGLLLWLANNSTIKSMYPFIDSCWTMPGIGQPTVHAPVNQLTTTSSNIIEMGAPATTSGSTPTTTPKTTTPDTTTPTAEPVTQSSLSTGETTSPRGTGGGGGGTPTTTPVSDQTTSPTNAPSGGNGTPTSAAASDQNTPPAGGGAPASNNGASQPNSPTAATTPSTHDAVAPTDSLSGQGQSTAGTGNAGSGNTGTGNAGTAGNTPLGTLTTSNDLASLLGAVASAANSKSTNGSPAAIVDGQTVQPGSATVLTNGETASISGDHIIIASGSSTRTELIAATTTPAIVFSGQTVVHGTATVIGGETVSISGTNLIVASGTETRTEPVPAASTPPAIYQGQSVNPGTATVINGATVSVSGTNLIIASGSSTHTEAIASSAVVIGGQTVYQGVPTVIDGETIRLSGTEVVVASGTATRTEGLGGAIISGLGGSGASVAPAAYTGAADRIARSEWIYAVFVVAMVRAVA